MKQVSIVFGCICMATLFLFACNNDEEDPDYTKGNTSIEVIKDKFYNGVDVSVDGDFLVIKTTNVPDHKSPYFTSGDANYTEYDGNNPDYIRNPNNIEEQDITFRVPLYPSEADNKEATPMGPMGVSINGVVFFNQYAAPGDDLQQEINTFDQYNGHPQQQGSYHYHLEPTYLTQLRGKGAFLGVLADGFPVYGPEENGEKVAESDLDAYHGHSHATPDFPDGIYHYHITDTDPYINGDGFYGTAGTISQ